jgi:hypothetical protein
MNKTSRRGLAILAGGLSFVGAANAIELVIDGSYESAVGGNVSVGGDDSAGFDGGWTHFTTYNYSLNYTQPGPPGSGLKYLRPYPGGGGSQVVSQTNSLARAITTTQIDTSNGQYTFSAWFSTYLGNNDYSSLTLQFLDATTNGIGSPVVIGGAVFVAALPGGTGPRAWGQDTKSGLVPPGARFAAITSASTALSGAPDGYVDLVSLDVIVAPVLISIASAAPATNAVNVGPNAIVNVVVRDGTPTLNTNSIQSSFDGSPVSPSIQKSGTDTTIQYDPPGLLAPLSTHNYRIAFNNAGSAAPNTTNQYPFTVGPYVNVTLPAPVRFEDFNSTPEGGLPAGWTQTNYTDVTDGGFDLADLNSASYATWVVVDRDRFTNSLNSYLALTPTLDYLRVLSTNQFNVVNGQVVTNLAQGGFVFGDSGYRSGLSQVLFLFSPDYNLTGTNNVYVSFHSLWEQNQDSFGAVEYSIDQGATWLPIVYLLHGPDVIRDGGGAVDAVATFSATRNDQATYVDPADSLLKGGYYGAFIGVASNQWSTLAPYISQRLDDNPVESKRVEVFRLAAADNQANVRFRFAHAGTDSWYFGIDDFGLYSIGSVARPIATAPSPASQTVAVGNSATFSVNAIGPGPLSYQWRLNGTNIPGRTNQVLGLSNIQFASSGSYDVIVGNPGGSVTSAPPAAVLTVLNPAVFVTGQWDFNQGDLRATCGTDMQYFDGTVSNDTVFGTTASFGISDINGQAANVMRFTPSTLAWGGYKLFHGASPNGGGTNANQYTVILDIFYPSSSDLTWRSLWQTDIANTSDGDVFVNTANGIGIGTYQGTVTAEAWHRIAFAFDLAGPGTAPVLTKFIDGVKVGEQTAGLSAVNGRFSLQPSALLFGDESGDVNGAYVSSVQFSNGRRPDAFIAALGGPSASKIPGAIKAAIEVGNTVIRWTGGVPLQSADSLAGPWATLGGVSSPYTPPAGSTSRYYRPKIP